MSVLALRGAITIESDQPENISAAVTRILGTLYERNGLKHDDVVSILFSATKDIRSAPPAAAARTFGLVDVPLLCTQEMDVEGSLPLCIRLMLHIETGTERADLRHVFLAGATVLRPELAESGDEQLVIES